MLDGTGFIYKTNNSRKMLYSVIKRMLDIIGSILGIVTLFPLFIVVGICIKYDSKGPVIFKQDRVGIRGKKFTMYKFRTMLSNAEELKDSLIIYNEVNGPMFKMKNDPRITKVGKLLRRTSIDELPQLFNVLKGEMSLVGPRPSLQAEVEKFDEWMMKRLEVKPGLTCYWQVCKEDKCNFINWMKLDIKYVEERSSFVDIKLIIKTIFTVFTINNN